MRNRIIILALINAVLTTANAQAPSKLWDAFFNGNLVGNDLSRSLVTDNAGNVFVTGKSFHTSPLGNFTTIKYDASGNELWADHYNTSGTGTSNEGLKLVIDKWQSVYAIGTVASNSGDIAIAKYNQSGRSWVHNYEAYQFGSDADFGVDIAIDSNANIYACGQVTSMAGNLWDMYAFKCDSSGTKLLDENFSSGSGDDFPAGITATTGGNVFALTNSFDFWGSGTYDMFTINYLANWNHNWVSIFDGASNKTDHATSIKVDNASNQYICGSSVNMQVNTDMLVMKQNQYGTTLWSTYYSGTANGNDTAVSVTWLPNNFVVVTGRSKEILNATVVDAFVTIVIDSGTVVWTKKFFGTDSLGAIPTQMTTDAQGNIYICGSELLNNGSKNGCIVKYSSGGNELWSISYDAGANLNDCFNSIALDFNNDILVTGQTFTSSTNASYVTVKYGNTASSVIEKEVVDISELTAYPNPFSEKVMLSFTLKESSSVSISIYDALGHISVENKPVNLTTGVNKIEIASRSLAQGIYYAEIKTATSIKRIKIISLG